MREWGRSCGLLGDSLGSWAPGEDFKGAGGSRSHAGVTLFPWSRGGAGGLQQPPSTTSGHRGQNILQNEVTKTVSYRTRNFPFGKTVSCVTGINTTTHRPCPTGLGIFPLEKTVSCVTGINTTTHKPCPTGLGIFPLEKTVSCVTGLTRPLKSWFGLQPRRSRRFLSQRAALTARRSPSE